LGYHVFISYRRDGGESMGQLLYSRLKDLGYSPFYDVETMRSGKFAYQLLEKIAECDDFILILPAHGLDRCFDEDDWVRKEIAEAIRLNKNIIPFMLSGFDCFPENLPEDISEIRYYNGILASMEYFDATLEKLKSLLTYNPAEEEKKVLWTKGYAFISYSSRNRNFVDSIKRILTKNGINSWIAPDNIPVGSKYADVINKAIKGCECVLLVLTNDAQDSIWVAKELERAIHYRKTIIPLQLENVVLNDEFEFYISSNHIVAIEKIDENSPEFCKAISVIRSITDNQTPASPPLQETSPQATTTNGLLCDYINLINSITLIEWNEVQGIINKEDYSSHLLDGIFFICKMATAQASGEEKVKWSDRLSFYESLYCIATRRGYSNLCDFFCSITVEEVIQSSENIKQYMLDNVDCFGKGKNGLDNLCFKMLMLSSHDTSIRHSYWEVTIKEIYELFRMIDHRANQ